MLSSSLVPQKFLTSKKARKSKRANEGIGTKKVDKEANPEFKNILRALLSRDGSQRENKNGGALWRNSTLIMASIR